MSVLIEGIIELVQPYLPLIQENLNPKDPATGQGRKDMEKGIEYLKEAVRLHPHNSGAQWYSGKAFQALWDYERAYGYFKAAYNLEPDDSSFSGALMECCWYLKKTKEAIEVARAALRMWPKDPDWISDYGYSLLKDGQVQKGKKLLLNAHRMDPEDVHTTERLNTIAEIESEEQDPLRLGALICDHENGFGGEVATILKEELCGRFDLELFFRTGGDSIMKIYKEHLIDIMIVNPAALSFHSETGYNPSKAFRREMAVSTLHDFHRFHQSRALVLDPWKDSRFLESFEGPHRVIQTPCGRQHLVNELRKWIEVTVPGLEEELLAGRFNILLFGDDIEIISFYAKFLSLEGFKCFAEFDAVGVYDVLNTKRMDILITALHPPDIYLPDLIADVKGALDTKIIVIEDLEYPEILDSGVDAVFDHTTTLVEVPRIINILLSRLYPEEEIQRRGKRGMRNIIECLRHEQAESNLI